MPPFDVGNLCLPEASAVVGSETTKMTPSKIAENNPLSEVGMLKKDKNIKLLIFFYVTGLNEFRV